MALAPVFHGDQLEDFKDSVRVLKDLFRRPPCFNGSLLEDLQILKSCCEISLTSTPVFNGDFLEDFTDFLLFLRSDFNTCF